MTRVPRRLRRQVAECFRRAIIQRISAMRVSEDGALDLLISGRSARRPETGLYVWSTFLPSGEEVTGLIEEPIPAADWTFFSALVDAVAAALHEGLPPGGIEIRHSPECVAPPDQCACNPRVRVAHGPVNVADLKSRAVAEAVATGVPVP